MNNEIILSANNPQGNLSEYAEWLENIKSQYRNAQLKAAVKVNSELLRFYWKLGHDLVTLKAEERWGAGIIERISLDFKEAFPRQSGFSKTNLWYMKKWYAFYAQSDTILHQAGGELENLLFQVPWRHHCEIITKCKTIEEATFYLQETVNNGWSRSALENALTANFYQQKGKAITNFKEHLPAPQSKLAQETLKDPYNFDFLTMREDYDERDLEDELTKHITQLLLELGKGFSFCGRQVELVVSGTSYRIDMLFYHIRLKCYVVVELKTHAFQPEYAGKLNFYVTAVDKLLKQEEDNPTIGLLICKTKDETKVEWAFNGINKPLGVAAYELNNILPKELVSKLPTIEEVEQGLNKVEVPKKSSKE